MTDAPSSARAEISMRGKKRVALHIEVRGGGVVGGYSVAGTGSQCNAGMPQLCLLVGLLPLKLVYE